MSLTSLADAPLLTAGLSLTKTRSRPAPDTKEDQAAIDALFQEGYGMEGSSSNAERKCPSPLRDMAKSAKETDVRNGIRDADTQMQNFLSLPTTPPLNQLNADLSKRRQHKHDDSLFTKTRDANDVLSRFLADNATDKSSNKHSQSTEEKTFQRYLGDNGGDKNSNKSSHSEEEKTCEREEFKGKWNSYSALPFGRLPTSANSPRPSLGSTLQNSMEPPSLSLTKTESHQFVSPPKQDDKPEIIEDILSLLPDGSKQMSHEAFISESARAATSTFNIGDDNLDFGGYQPSCLSMPALNSSSQRTLTSFLVPSQNVITKETRPDKIQNEHHPCLSVKSLVNQGLQQTGSLCHEDEKFSLSDLHKRNPLQVQDSPIDKISIPSLPAVLSKSNNEGLALEVQRLKEENLALREELMKIESEKLEIEKEILKKELSYEPEAVKQASMDSKEAQQIADQLASELLLVRQSLLLTEERIKSMTAMHQKEMELLKDMHLAEIEARDKQLHMERALVAEKKGAMEAFYQLVHKANEWSAKIDQLHKRLVCENEAPSAEKLSWIANIGSVVSEHGCSLHVLEKQSTEVCSQLEKVVVMLDNVRKDMDRIPKQDEHMVGKGYDHLETFQLQERDPRNEEAYPAGKGLLDFDTKAEHLELTRYELHRCPYSASDVSTSSLYCRELLSREDTPQTEALLRRELDEDFYYLKSQEDFLIQAEKALQDMERAPLNGL